MNKKIKLYFATEENAFEGELLNKFNSVDDAVNEVKNYIKEDFAEESEDVRNEALDNVDKYGYTGEDAKGYVVIYFITEDGRKARSEFANYRHMYFD